MSLGDLQPFVGSQAYNKANSAYVSFPSQADVMLASLQLFHDVPCRFMDLFLSVISHPGFDPEQVSLCNLADIIGVVEESRLRDRMAAVYERAQDDDGHMQQVGSRISCCTRFWILSMRNAWIMLRLNSRRL